MRLGILSDAHGNVEAFRLALRTLARANVEAIYFLGDAVGYIPDAGVVSLLYRSEIVCVRGNHDDMLVRRSASAEQQAIYRHEQTFAGLSAEERAFLAGLPSQIGVERGGVKLLFVHGSPIDTLTGYVYPDTDLSQFSDVEGDAIFMGHTHRPFVRGAHDKMFVNVGSCGLPRGDDPRGSVCVFDTNERSAQIIRFDISECCKDVLSRYDLSPSVAALLNRCVQVGRGQAVE